MLKNKKLFYVVSILAGALIGVLLLELGYFINDFGALFGFIFGRPLVFLFNWFLMIVLALIVVTIIRKPFVSMGILWALIFIVNYIHINKYNSRGTPLLPEDFQLASQAASLTKFIDVWSLAGLAFAVLVALAAGILLERYAQRKIGRLAKHSILTWLTALVLFCGVFNFATDFIRNHDGSKYQKINWLNTTFTAWNQKRNYDENGFIVGFLYNWNKFNLAAPENYDEETIMQIKNEYSKNTASKNLSDADYNIVIVLNESFYDPSLIEKYYPHTGGDVTPNLHKVMAQYPSGWMYTLDYGGGTANIEFETLTGLTNFWVNTVPYTDLVPKAGNIPSVATWTKQNGYKTTAIHPYNGGMYKRDISLMNEGFETFITELEMKHKEHEGDSEYINDKSAYNEVVDTLRADDNKQMIMLITMQNHLPYNSSTYSDHHFSLINPIANDAERTENIRNYYESLYNSDKYLGDFIAELDTMDEKTVVLFFGDHSAGLFSELNDSSNNSEEFILSRTTPYFIYSNFPLNGARKNLPNTTPNCLVNTLYNTLGVEKPALNYLLDDVCTTEPILARTYFDEKEFIETDILNAYELVTYDILGGKKYWMQD